MGRGGFVVMQPRRVGFSSCFTADFLADLISAAAEILEVEINQMDMKRNTHTKKKRQESKLWLLQTDGVSPH